jgi:hypothetical protein
MSSKKITKDIYIDLINNIKTIAIDHNFEKIDECDGLFIFCKWHNTIYCEVVYKYIHKYFRYTYDGCLCNHISVATKHSGVDYSVDRVDLFKCKDCGLEGTGLFDYFSGAIYRGTPDTIEEANCKLRIIKSIL